MSMMDCNEKYEIKVQLERYQKYRTFVPMSDSEIQKYQTPDQIQNTLDKDYAEILFGEDNEGDENDEAGWSGKITKIVLSDSIPAESVIRSSGTSIYGDISEAKDGSVIGWVEKPDAADSEYDMDDDEADDGIGLGR